MNSYQEYQRLQHLLSDPKYQPYVNLAKKLTYYASYYLIWALQTVHSLVSRYPQVSDWLGYLFSLYMAYLTIKRAIRVVKSSSYVILVVFGLYVWQRGVSQVILMDLPYLADRLKQYVHNLPRDAHGNGSFLKDVYAPFYDLYNSLQALF
ncbi:Apq12p [Kluyveromyces lactis]|uniref:KLLA0E04445p n=1 Tax=Kluyveromyces lactis (strain ATCC 8585 / CBS 2359 / DSM 70799 / NBRC 1267 / NRRL Y-1140 / WM37) TaxID=284590 RepID=Q6CPJ3_KLULA|nr:uncharacterized protein KLLA0_E04445g [Kluyveromyces lactis]CAG99233.1 KLLA0E04445p [Kluyveromyces lactis]|eukprot:XP_454146.1 uncharacterized protein KLLA0_E04445g [Kluyveromyces lactis]